MSKMLKVKAKDVVGPREGGGEGRSDGQVKGLDITGAVIAVAAAKSLNDRTRTAGNCCRSHRRWLPFKWFLMTK